MELFGIILLGVGLVSGAIVFWMELSITNDRLQFLEERLYKLEKDAVKITFSDPYSPQDEKPVKKIKPLTEGRVKSQIKEYEGEMPMTQAPPPPKTLPVLGEWQTKNGSPKYKRKPKTE